MLRSEDLRHYVCRILRKYLREIPYGDGGGVPLAPVDENLHLCRLPAHNPVAEPVRDDEDHCHLVLVEI
jgi:hypothetical protein